MKRNEIYFTDNWLAHDYWNDFSGWVSHMKYLITLLSIGLIGSLFMGCATANTVSQDLVDDCLDEQVGLYNDLCAESSAWDKKTARADIHKLGVTCAVESIRMCMEKR